MDGGDVSIAGANRDHGGEKRACLGTMRNPSAKDDLAHPECMDARVRLCGTDTAGNQAIFTNALGSVELFSGFIEDSLILSQLHQ
jgi:hypothetical protein